MRPLLFTFLAAVSPWLVFATADVASAGESDWIFLPGRYSHSPATGERVAQYAPPPALPPFPDSRGFASGFQRTRVNQRGPGGTGDTYYRVENWGNGQGGIDAEWERFNDVWQRSVVAGGYGGYGYGAAPNYGGPYASPWGPVPGYPYPANGPPGYSYPAYGNPAYGYPGHPYLHGPGNDPTGLGSAPHRGSQRGGDTMDRFPGRPGT